MKAGSDARLSDRRPFNWYSAQAVEEGFEGDALVVAAEKGNLAKVEKLLGGGADINTRGKQRQTALYQAILYDHFTPYVLMQLEEFGFCGRGEAKDFVRDGAIELGGRLPINPHGGQLGEAYIHGMNGIAEGVRQVRGTSVNQVPAVHNVLVTAGTGVPTSGLILSTAT